MKRRNKPVLLSVRQAKEIDNKSRELLGISTPVLMENAGRAVAEELIRMTPGAGKVAVFCGNTRFNRMNRYPAFCGNTRSKRMLRCAIFCGKGNNGGDGLVAAMQLLTVVQEEDRPVSEVCKRFEKVPQLLNNVRFQKGKPLDNKLVKQVIAESNSRLGDKGRLIIRESGTEPVIRVMGEGDDEGLVAAVVRDIANAIRQVA